MEHILETEREALRLRLVAVLLVAAGLYLVRREADWLPAVLLALGYLGYAVVLRAFLLPRLSFSWVVYGMIVVDVAAVSLGLLIVGGTATPLFILLPALILYYSVHLGYASSLAAATVSSLAYSGLSVLTGEAEWVGAFLGFQVPLFYILALIGGFLTEKRFEERREKESLQEAIGLERGARSLLEVTRALGNTLEMETVLRQVLNSALALAGIRAGIVALRQKADGRLMARAASVRPEEMGLKEMGQAFESPEKDSPTLLALETLKPQWVPDLKQEERAVPPWLKALPYRSLLVAPLVHQGRAVGVLYLLGDGLGPDVLAQASTLGELAGMALSNASLYEESQDRVTYLKGEFEELVGRVERLRQAQRKRAILVNGLQIDLAKGEVTVDGKAVGLSRVEFDLLWVLAENAGEPLTHETLLRLVWGPQYQGQANVVDVSIHRLRRKIEREPSRPKRIVTVRGVGYMLSTGSQAIPSERVPLPPRKVV